MSGAGLLILLVAGDILVRGAVALSLRLGIPALIISLTVVAFGTSAPELLIAVQAALEGVPGIAFGNVIGSNTANVLLVLGVPALMTGLNTGQYDTRSSYLQMLAASFVFIAICYLGPLYIWHGIVLLIVLAAILISAARSAGRARNRDVLEELDEVASDTAGWLIAVLLIVGIVGLPIGAHLLIEGARGVAQKMGVSDALIGLTLVAVGTSLPELATSVMAALRGKADVALGNAIGSNMFNLLGIMGVASFFGPLAIDGSLLSFDIWVMLAASFLLIPFAAFRADMSRMVGFGFVVIYAGYMAILFTKG